MNSVGTVGSVSSVGSGCFVESVGLVSSLRFCGFCTRIYQFDEFN